ncbi:hypothetical protein [Desulfovibrio sp. TomC]|uniref:hypothetical protein n=1 Tax=Desulfovibrio sp. TomC TaxID=1562888 RepID=UPI000573E20C|nr:hypothetical protein [Desulfovibrio sp. TomC]KHK01433.1 hypothetical protein NY78_3187 [Desulfovibrio sp. TomC]
MRGIFVFIALAMCVMLGGTAMARQPDGFAGTAFGTPLATLPSFTPLKKDGNVTYAVNLAESYRLNGQAPVVVYGFASGKLFAAFVRLDGLIEREAMVKRLVEQYGQPVVAMDDGSEVLRWRKGKVKIKLKANAATGSLKLAYYSGAVPGPAAKRLELDNVDIDALVKLYEKDKISKNITLPAASPEQRSPFDGKPAAPDHRIQ